MHQFNLHRPVIVDEATDFFKTVGVSDFTFDSCKLWGWRCRAKLAVRGSPENPLLGLYQEGTHNVVDISQCKAHPPSINAAVELLKQDDPEVPNVRHHRNFLKEHLFKESCRRPSPLTCNR